MQVDADVPEDCRTKDLIEAMQDAKSFLDGETAEEDTEAFDRSFPELSNAAAGAAGAESHAGRGLRK